MFGLSRDSNSTPGSDINSTENLSIFFLSFRASSIHMRPAQPHQGTFAVMDHITRTLVMEIAFQAVQVTPQADRVPGLKDPEVSEPSLESVQPEKMPEKLQSLMKIPIRKKLLSPMLKKNQTMSDVVVCCRD